MEDHMEDEAQSMKVEEAPATEEVRIEDKITPAIRARLSDFKNQADSLTLEGVRRALEKDLGLKAFSLDSHKRFIKQRLEECFIGPDELKISKNSVENSAVVQPEKKETTKKLEDCQASKEVKDHTSKLDEQPKDSADTVGKDTSERECGSDLNEDTIKMAVEKRAAYFRENSKTISLSGVRRLLEDDLKLERNTLDAYKGFISKLLDEVLSSEFIEPANGIKKQPKKTTQATNVDKKIKQSKTNVKRKNEVFSDSDEIHGGDEEVDEENKKPKKRAPQNEKVRKNEVVKKHKLSNEKSKPSSSVKKKPAEVAVENSVDTEEVGNSSEDGHSQSSSEEDVKKRKETSTQVYGKRVEDLKSIIKSCGMSVPPAVYRRAKQAPESKREASLIKELEEILEREGLSANPSEKDIKTVKKKKERAKELEGIDMSNIVSTSRRRNTFDFIPPKPQIPVESDEDEDEDEEEDEEDTEDDNSDNGVSSKGSDEDDGDESE